jgi:hypothetical protein
LRRVLGVAAGLVMVPYPEFAVLLLFLCIFWENLGSLALSAYDDYQLTKTEKALRGSLSANVDGYCVRLPTMMSMAERKGWSRSILIWQRTIKAVYTAFVRASNWVRLLAQCGNDRHAATTQEE